MQALASSPLRTLLNRPVLLFVKRLFDALRYKEPSFGRFLLVSVVV